MEDDCVFCKIVRGHEEIIMENENFVVVKDIYPKVEGHLLVISKEHYDTFLDMPSEIYEDLLKISRAAAVKIVEEVDVEGFNFFMNNGETAGQIINHVHWHILPRKKGDGFVIGI